MSPRIRGYIRTVREVDLIKLILALQSSIQHTRVVFAVNR